MQKAKKKEKITKATIALTCQSLRRRNSGACGIIPKSESGKEELQILYSPLFGDLGAR